MAGRSKAYLRALRKKHGLGEFSRGRKRKRRTTAKRRRGRTVRGASLGI